MKLHRDIPWFNPREMDDQTILALSTGQNKLLQAFMGSVQIHLSSQVPSKHWLVTGSRGGGKSFFLRFVQARFNQIQNPKIKLVLLPEELINIFSPHEWLNAIQLLLDSQQNKTASVSAWNSTSTDKAWDKALASLLTAFDNELLIIAVENFDDLLNQAFDNDIDSSRLRSLLENEPRIMLLATAVDSSFDENYQKRLFCQFEHHQIQPWAPLDHREYLIKRAKLEEKQPDNTQLARIDAYSRYTGGNARVASVLASLILEKQDPLLASADLAATLDKMTDYYRAQVERIPVKTRKLFDALLRGGEPCSQTQLAERVQARQSDISRAFIWLMDFGYIIGLREKGQKATRYQVADRLFSQFYRMRYLQPGKNTQLTILADLLADTIELADKWRYAERYLNDGLEDEARTMAELGLKDRGINLEDISANYQSTQSLVTLGQDWELSRIEEVLETFLKARNNALKYKHPKNAILYLDQIARCQSVLAKPTESMATHQQAINEKETQGITTNIAWNIGQIARHKVTLEGIVVAWEFLDQHEFSEEKDRINSVRQLADSIFDYAQNKGEAAAFSLGCQLFSELKKRPQYPTEATLRALWIDMVDMRVPFIVLRDLAAEVVNILGEDLSPLIEILVAWLDDLEQNPKEKIEHRKTLNPDLATTLEALGKNLSLKTKAALQL